MGKNIDIGYCELMKPQEQLRNQIKSLVRQYALNEDAYRHSAGFIAGTTIIPPSGKVIGDTELIYMTDAVLDGWLTAGRFNVQFELELSKFLNIKLWWTPLSRPLTNFL